MSDDLDPNKLVAEFINSNLDRFTESVLSSMKGTKTAIRAKLKKTYQIYIERVHYRHAKAKSFFVRTEPLPLYDFFVPPDISTSFRNLKAPTMFELASAAPAAIISGSGGSGKTMLMRHLLISCIEAKQKTPVLLELRQLNREDHRISDALIRTLNANGLAADENFLKSALRAGNFCILLDGFDELEHEIRKNVAIELQTLAETYPNNWFVLSSRPDSKLEGWTSFTYFSVKPLDLPRAVELVKKVPYDESIKSQFVEKLHSGLYETHESFLSNPLLLSIMLLTYNDNAQIPDKLSIFYSQAYESLFQKHDALKGGFQRDRLTTLDIQDYGKVFAAFSVQSYHNQEFQFSRTAALEYFDKAKEISGIDYDSNGILDDSIQAVCLMLEDGLDIKFVHRSFQEYFVARFIRSAPHTLKKKLMNRFQGGIFGDPIMQLLFEMDKFAVEEYFLLPIIDKLEKEIGFKTNVGVNNYVRYLKYAYSTFQVDKAAHWDDDEEIGEEPKLSLSAGIMKSQLFNAIRLLRTNYSNEFNLLNYRPKTDNNHLEHFFIEQYGYGPEAVIHSSSLQTTTPFVKELMKQGGQFGIEHLRDLLKLATKIRASHETQSSLSAIFQTGSK